MADTTDTDADTDTIGAFLLRVLTVISKCYPLVENTQKIQLVTWYSIKK